MKANRKYIESRPAVSGVIEVILLVAITVAIASTFYVFFGISGSVKSADLENASVVGSATQDQIRLVLVSGGEGYNDAYNIQNDVRIFVNGIKVSQYDSTIWTIGANILIGDTILGDWEEGVIFNYYFSSNSFFLKKNKSFKIFKLR
jgi:FlaG/FlaF family flagellin (archaellin)